MLQVLEARSHENMQLHTTGWWVHSEHHGPQQQRALHPVVQRLPKAPGQDVPEEVKGLHEGDMSRPRRYPGLAMHGDCLASPGWLKAFQQGSDLSCPRLWLVANLLEAIVRNCTRNKPQRFASTA